MNSLVQHITSLLDDLYDRDEAVGLAWWIAEETTGLSRTQLICDCKDTAFSPYMQEVVERLRHFEPIQYIFGHTEWCGLDLRLTPATLIPRPETAELVNKISNFKLHISNLPVRVLDIGTGSGCIAIALKQRHPEWHVTGIDISGEAIEISKENAQRNQVEVNFLVADIFDEIGKNMHEQKTTPHYDVVVSNPPYICESERATMRPNVLEHEPTTALFVPDNDPLLFYRRIAQLRLGKQLFFEINEAYAAETALLLRSEGYTDINVHHDNYGRQRFIYGRMA